MVKHIILWTLNPELSDEQKEEVKKGIKAGLESLKGVVPGLIDVKVNVDDVALRGRKRTYHRRCRVGAMAVGEGLCPRVRPQAGVLRPHVAMVAAASGWYLPTLM